MHKSRRVRVGWTQEAYEFAVSKYSNVHTVAGEVPSWNIYYLKWEKEREKGLSLSCPASDLYFAIVSLATQLSLVSCYTRARRVPTSCSVVTAGILLSRTLLVCSI
jgi:hypothetical protein